MGKTKKGKVGCWFLAAGIMLLCAAILQACARNIPGFGEWYATTVYPQIVGTVGRLFGIFPASVVEVALYLLIILCLVYGIAHIRQIPRLISRTCFLVAALFLVYTLNCGINYYRYPFSMSLGLEVRESSKEELVELCQKLTGQVNALRRETDGVESISQINKDGVTAMQELGLLYPELSGVYPQPKALLWSYILSVQQLCGIYSPFTIEANYNREMTPYNIPLTVCHELSHLKGFMREDEANFIGYLACINSDSAVFTYSGSLMGWIYAGNALAAVDMEAYRQVYSQLDEMVMMDLRRDAEFWNQYEGKVAEAANNINDRYLKFNDQSDGVQSYGRVVDLMLAYERDKS